MHPISFYLHKKYLCAPGRVYRYTGNSSCLCKRNSGTGVKAEREAYLLLNLYYLKKILSNGYFNFKNSKKLTIKINFPQSKQNKTKQNP